ncbi:MAG: pantoate--beta-alanine ligase [Bacteroidota bacterium]|nr:pantoate--beta-alanine ligase [Bacteroidota bacterium]
MVIFNTIAEIQLKLHEHAANGHVVGFVPTMGALHKGHLSLIQECRINSDITVCSIFVNPKQFNNSNDLQKYPRTLEKDILLLENAGCDILFCPTSEEMYPFKTQLEIQIGPLDKILEGKFRPGHLKGVALVVLKLFNIIQPNKVFFGQKDLQQCFLIQQLIKELSYNIDFYMIETLRESDGLAMSSRNVRLSESERKKAPILYETMLMAKALVLLRKIDEVKNVVIKKLEHEKFKLEYFEFVDLSTFKISKKIKKKSSYAICVAGYFDEVRLIDNIIFNT